MIVVDAQVLVRVLPWLTEDPGDFAKLLPPKPRMLVLDLGFGGLNSPDASTGLYSPIGA